MDLPGDARVFLEAYYRSSVMRFDMGEVASLNSPLSSRLEEIQSEIVFFRVKIVDLSDGVGRILAIADSISPGTDVPRASLLPVAYRDLGERIWRLELDSPAPVLEVNNQIRSDVAIREIVRREPAFLSLVLPSVLREILTHILIIQEHLDTEGESWQSQWLHLASSYPAVNALSSLPPDPRRNVIEYIDWIEDAVNAFSKHHRIKPKFEEWLEEL